MDKRRNNFYVKSLIRTLKELNKFDEWGKRFVIRVEKQILDTDDEFFPHIIITSDGEYYFHDDVRDYFFNIIKNQLLLDLKKIYIKLNIEDSYNSFELENRARNTMLYSYLDYVGINFGDLINFKSIFYPEYYK